MKLKLLACLAVLIAHTLAVAGPVEIAVNGTQGGTTYLTGPKGVAQSARVRLPLLAAGQEVTLLTDGINMRGGTGIIVRGDFKDPKQPIVIRINQDEALEWSATQTFSGPLIAADTLQLPSSATLPDTCNATPAEIYVDLDAPSGQRLFVCESNNTWVPILTTDFRSGTGVKLYDTDNTNWVRVQPPTLSANWTLVLPQDDGEPGDVLCVPSGDGVSDWCTPGGGGDITQVWADDNGDVSALTAAAGDTFDAGSADSSKPATRSTSLPPTCAEGQLHQDTDSNGSELYVCTAANTWTTIGAGNVSSVGNCATGDCFTGTSGSTLTSSSTMSLLSPDNVYVRVDTDANDTGAFVIAKEAGTSMFEVNEDGTARFWAGLSPRLYEADNSNWIHLTTPILTANWTLTLPVDDGTNGQFLQTNGSGGTSWGSVGDCAGSGCFAGTSGATLTSSPAASFVLNSQNNIYLSFDTDNNATNTGVVIGSNASGSSATPWVVIGDAAAPSMELRSGTDFRMWDTDGSNYVQMEVGAMSSNYTLAVPLIAGTLAVERVFDARAYGVKCDDSTNDATALQAAIDAAEATINPGNKQGGVVELPVGICIINSGLTMNAAGVILRGQGAADSSNGTILSVNFGTGTAITLQSDCDYCGVERMSIKSRGAPPTTLVLIDGTDAGNDFVRYVDSGVGQYCVAFKNIGDVSDASLFGPVAGSSCRAISVVDNAAYIRKVGINFGNDIEGGIVIEQTVAGQVDTVVIDNVEVAQSGGKGAGLKIMGTSATNPPRWIQVSNSLFEAKTTGADTGDYAIWLSNVRDFKCSSCYAQGGYNSVRISGGPGPIVFSASVIGNSMQDALYHDADVVTTLVGTTVSDGGTETNNTHADVYLSTNSRGFNMIGGAVGAELLGFASNDPAYGIEVAAGADEYRFSDVNCTDIPATSCATGLAPAAVQSAFTDSTAYGDDNWSNYVMVRAPGTVTANWTMTLPPDDGSANYVMKTDGSGVTSWSAVLQANDAGGYVIANSTGSAGNRVLVLQNSTATNTPTEDTYIARTTTTDGTQTSVTFEVPGVPSGAVTRFTANVVARCTGGASCGTAVGGNYTVTWACINVGGSTSILGAADIDVEQESASIAATWAVTGDCDDTSDTGRLRVTGAATSNITWLSVIKKMSVTS